MVAKMVKRMGKECIILSLTPLYKDFIVHLQLRMQIIIIDNGKIVESGKHDQLLLENELYTKLYKMQFRSQ